MGAAKRPPGVMLYFKEMRPIFALLSAKDRGDLVMMVLDYAELGKEPVFRPGSRLDGIWPNIREMIDRDSEVYQAKCEKAKKAAQARWEQKGKEAESVE